MSLEDKLNTPWKNLIQKQMKNLNSFTLIIGRNNFTAYKYSTTQSLLIGLWNRLKNPNFMGQFVNFQLENIQF